MIYFIPLEELTERYSKLMNDIAREYLDDSQILYPKWKKTKIVKGEFLDVEKTIHFKCLQLIMISELFQNGKVKDGDTFFFADIFFPGIESVKYQSELQNIKINIAAFNHAGRADQNDFVQNLGDWADDFEQGYHELCDVIFVGSVYHKKNIIKYFNVNPRKIFVTGCVWDTKKAFEVYPKHLPKEDFVIWPHRVSKEKGIGDLIDIAEAMPNKKFIISSSGNKNINIKLPKNIEYINNLTKKGYYKLLSKAKYYLSTAHQETFGYTLREALLYKCIIVVPNELCYPEQVPQFCLYERNDINYVISMLEEDGIILNKSYWNKYHNNFGRMLHIIKHNT